MSSISEVFGIGKEKGIEFWKEVIRQTYVKEIVTKEIESYGTIKLTNKGREFIKNPQFYSLLKTMTTKTTKNSSSHKGSAMDNILFDILKN